MTIKRTISCDACGEVLVDDAREVSLQIDKASMTSIDPKPDTDGYFPWRSASWDLCAEDALEVYKAVVKLAGRPDHDSISERLKEEA